MAATGFSLITIHSNFTYDYTPNSNLIQSVTGPVHTVTNTWEPSRDVLDIKQNKVGTDIVSKYEYAVNAIGQRTGVTTSGSAFPGFPSWLWGYDHLGQVVSADSSVSTSDRAYEYDAIGNRKKSANSLTLPGTDNYSSNALNQYTAVDTLSPAYDFDGNATAYPLPVAPSALSGLGWDGENRLISSTVGTTTTTYLYDAQSRRIAKSTAGSSTIYLYDTWNCIAEYTQSAPTAPVVLAKTRLWGTDLSGTAQGAGGVGGLLAEDHHSGTAATFYPTYDGNGNVSEYLAVDGSPAAHFEYDPFGNTVVASGSAGLFDYRFSTKPRDSETGLYYYLYRYYDPVTGRWPSRDPIEEKGGLNLYGTVENDLTNSHDFLGLTCKGVATHGHITTVNKKRRGLDEEFKDDQKRQNDKDSKNDPYPTAYSGCGANNLNKQAVAGGWGCPNTRKNAFPTDGKWPEDASPNAPHGPNHPDVDDSDYLDEDNEDASIDAAIKAAGAEVCKKDKECCSAEIEIECTGYAPGEAKHPKCGTTEDVPCEKK